MRDSDIEQEKLNTPQEDPKDLLIKRLQLENKEKTNMILKLRVNEAMLKRIIE